MALSTAKLPLAMVLRLLIVALAEALATSVADSLHFFLTPFFLGLSGLHPSFSLV